MATLTSGPFSHRTCLGHYVEKTAFSADATSSPARVTNCLGHDTLEEIAYLLESMPGRVGVYPFVGVEEMDEEGED